MKVVGKASFQGERAVLARFHAAPMGNKAYTLCEATLADLRQAWLTYFDEIVVSLATWTIALARGQEYHARGSGAETPELCVLRVCVRGGAMRSQRRSMAWVLGLLCVAGLTGCGQSGPFPVTPVSGQLRFAKPLSADRVVIRFVPQGIVAGKDSAIPAEGSVDPASGVCTGLTTLKPNDGAIVGRHKVIVIALKNGPQGEKPIDAVPPKYRDPKTTPLEYEVKSGAPPFEFTVDAK